MFAVVLIIINYLKLINNLNIIAQKVSSCCHRRGLRFATAVFSVLSLSSFPSPKGSPILRVFFSVTINKYRTFSFNEFHAFLFSSFSLLCRFLPLFCSGGDRTASFPVFFFLVLLLGFNLNIQYMKKLSTIFKTLASSVFTTNHLAARTLRSLFGFLII